MSLGGGLEPHEIDPIAGNPIVVHFAPQLELLKHASLVITHGGLNSTLESLALGVPLVAIPVIDDQPGVAERIRWAGVGAAVPIRELTPQALTRSINRVLRTPSYRETALMLAAELRNIDGLDMAATIIEKAMKGDNG